jgi:hypothetical protein
MKMQWDVLCANPIVPADWTVTYQPYLRPTDTFNLTFTTAASKDLATRFDSSVTRSQSYDY